MLLGKNCQILLKGYRASQHCLLSNKMDFHATRAVGNEADRKNVYELRTYSAYPHTMKDLMAITKEKFSLRTQHSKLLAYWTTEIGGINEVVHLWEYNDLEHRAGVRTALTRHEPWQTEFISKATTYLRKMDNMVLTLLPNSPEPRFSKTAGVFLLHYYYMKTGENLANQSDILAECLKEVGNETENCLVGLWQSVIGKQGVIVVLWQHPSPNHVIHLNQKLLRNQTYVKLRNEVVGSYSKMMNPFITELWS